MSDRKKITVRMHGLSEQRNSVAAQEFVRKLSAVVRGLSKADKLENGRRCLDFLITDLKMGSAEAQITEHQASTKYLPRASGVAALHNAAHVVSQGAASGLNGSSDLLIYLRGLSVNANKGFSHIDLIVDDDDATAIRIDSFFADQVQAAREAIRTAEDRSRKHRFKGRSRASFDGTLKAADHRGATKLAILTLTAGLAEIECAYSEKIASEIGQHFDTRCRVDAWAHYDGSSGLPRRLELIGATAIKQNANIKDYRGAFKIEPSDDLEWL